jgi:hypothetical protein
MQQVDRAKMQTLFEDIAKIASPGTASEEVEIDIF